MIMGNPVRNQQPLSARKGVTMVGRPRSPHATIADVAARAGVSSATVSRVLNRNPSVDPIIAARVRESIELLSYAPSQAARSLSLGRTNTVAVVVPDLENPMFHGVLRGVSRGAEAAGYHVIVADTSEDPAIEAETAREARRLCDAIILAAPRMPEAELRDLMTELAPVIIVNRQVAGSPAVTIDYVAAVRELVSELVTNGHRSIGYLAGPPESASNSERLIGVEEARRRYPGVRFVELPGGSRIDDGLDAVDRILESGVTALIAYNDLAALGVLGALVERGVAVPGRISVAGIDDVPFARVSYPPLTSMSLPRLDLGLEAWRQLKAMIDGEDAGEPERMAPTLVRRASTGAAPTAEPRPSRLLVNGAVLAEYSDGAELDQTLSRRPYLHPVSTLGGNVVTATRPADHEHHLGLSLTIPDVNGTSFWGGSTYVRDRGSVPLENHGVQRRDWFDWSPGRIGERLTWLSERRAPLLAETRTISARGIAGGWALDWTSELSAIVDVSIGSPATNGREGAGYGGLFWRFPFDSARLISEAGTGADAVHGAPSRWLAVVDTSPTPLGSVLLVQPGALPWFVRDEEYVGACPALAWSERLEIEAGSSLTVGLTALVLDRLIEDAADVSELLRELEPPR
jgi:LacI family transcriptional regulator